MLDLNDEWTLEFAREMLKLKKTKEEQEQNELKKKFEMYQPKKAEN